MLDVFSTEPHPPKAPGSQEAELRHVKEDTATGWYPNSWIFHGKSEKTWMMIWGYALWLRKHLFSPALSFHGNPLADLVALLDFDLWLTPNYLGQAFLWKFTWPWRKETAWNPHESFRQITHWQQMSNRSLKPRKARPASNSVSNILGLFRMWCQVHFTYIYII